MQLRLVGSADRKTGNSPAKAKGPGYAKGVTSSSAPKQHWQGNGKACVSQGVCKNVRPSKYVDARSWADGEQSDKAWTRPSSSEACEEEEEEEGGGEERAAYENESDDSSTGDAMPDGSGLERALPTIHFSCRSSVRDGIDTEFEITSDSSSSSLCSVSGRRDSFMLVLMVFPFIWCG
jgi:hypothetical protein